MNLARIVLALCACLLTGHAAYAELRQLDLDTVSDSEEPFARRIYSYDFDVTPDGRVLAVYSRPVPGEDRAQIVFMSKRVGGNWPSPAKRLVLEEFGSVPSISTWVVYDAPTETAHVAYIVKRDFEDANGTIHAGGLVHQTVEDGVPGRKTNVSPGGFTSRMQLDELGSPVFVREYEIFTLDGKTFFEPPFEKALRVQVQRRDGSYSDREYILDLPPADDYRLGNFLYDTITGRLHITYGDKDAVFLRNTYPTVNPPVTPDKRPVFFPPGAGHRLWYAYSDDLETWEASLIDRSGNLSENEFWTDLELNSEGVPHAASFRYRTDAQGVHQGSTNIIGYFDDDKWVVRTVAGKTTGASPSRAGMGTKLVATADGGFHAIWDNSPDKPIDAEVVGDPGESAGGISMYRYSPDGEHWAVRQVLFPFSIEGQVRARLYGDRLLVMALGDARDARLVFGEFRVPGPDDSVFEISSDKMFYGAGEDIQLHVRVQGDPAERSAVYVAVSGPFDVDGGGELVALPTTRFWYLDGAFQWREFTDVNAIQPVVSALPMNPLQLYFMSPTANAGVPPFDKPSRYRLYSGVTPPGSDPPVPGRLPPLQLYLYDLHVCSEPGCAEL